MKPLLTLILLVALQCNAFCKIFNVKEFGALGDGKANDRAAIQAAIDNATAYSLSHGNEMTTVYFPDGKYRLKEILKEFTHPVSNSKIQNADNSLLNVYSNLELVGNRHSILLAGEKLNNDEPFRAFNIIYVEQPVNNFLIHKLTFDLNGSANMFTDEKNLQRTKNAAICLRRGRKIKIDSITVRNSVGRQCISIGTNSKDFIHVVKNLIISNCVIENIGDCFQHDLIQSDHSSIFAMADSVDIFNNRLLCGGTPSKYSTAIECHISNGRVHHNSINNYNIGFNIVALWYDQENTNYFDNEINNSNEGFRIWTSNQFKMKHLEISTNKANLSAAENYGFIYQVDKTNGRVDEVIVKNNEVKNISDDARNHYPAILFTKASAINIVGNTFVNYAKNIVMVQDLEAKNSEIKNNVVKNNPNNNVCNEGEFNARIVIRNQTAISLSDNCTY